MVGLDVKKKRETGVDQETCWEIGQQILTFRSQQDHSTGTILIANCREAWFFPVNRRIIRFFWSVVAIEI